MRYEDKFYHDELKLMEELYSYYDNKDEEIYILQEKNKKKSDNKLTELFLTLSLLNLIENEKNKILSECNSYFSDMFKSEFLYEKQLLIDNLKSFCKDTYDLDNYLYKLGSDKKVKNVENSFINKVINTKIENKTNTQRIKDNKDKTFKNIIGAIELFLDGYITLDYLHNKVADIFKTNKSDTKRLFNNERYRCNNKVKNQWQKDNNIQYIQYVSVLEDNTCQECKDLHGKVYKLGTEIELSRHIQCACYYTPIITDWKYDGEVNFKDFKERNDK